MKKYNNKIMEMIMILITNNPIFLHNIEYMDIKKRKEFQVLRKLHLLIKSHLNLTHILI